jgi:hypothetical protein
VLHPRQIVYFNFFYFKNGNTAKAKYFIVLARTSNQAIVASLPTSKNHIPSFIKQEHGCIDDEDSCFNCYCIEANKVIGENGFSFYRPTFLYGDQLEIYELEIFEDVYSIPGVDYEIQDLLLVNEYNAILNCFRNSKRVKNKLKRLL